MASAEYSWNGVEGGVTQGSIFGGFSTGYGNVEKNTVNIKAGKVGYSATDGSEVAGLSICGGSLIEAGKQRGGSVQLGATWKF